MAFWKKNWKKINEGKASKKTQNAFIDLYKTMRAENERQGTEKLPPDGGLEEVQGDNHQDPWGTV